MKLFTIGRSPQCDIVLNNPAVSSLHAELTLLDNGEIIIEDKQSANGTTVGNRRIEPNTEVSIRRGDFVRLANVDLPWVRIPMLETQTKFKQVVNIGSNFRNDVVVYNGTVSRYHATLKIAKDGKAYICDNKSTNGTQVNGVKLQPNKDVRVKRGDIVLCAQENITDQIEQFLPKPVMRNIWISVAAACVAALVGFGIFKWVNNGGSPREYIPAVVYVQSAYHYDVTVKTNLGELKFRYPGENENPLIASGTAFFVDKEGRMGTCRHVVVPWDEAYSKDTRDEVEKKIRQYLHSQVRVSHVTNQKELDRLMSTEIGEGIAELSDNIHQLNANISTILNGPITIDGKMDYLAVAYSGRNYQSTDQFQRCAMIAESGTADKDVALLQLDEKKTPQDVPYFDINKITDQPLKPMEDELYTIGFPYGLLWGMDDATKSLESNIRETKCSKIPSKFYFEFQATSQGGASGSPVFLKNGRLVGILSQVRADENGPTLAAHAIFLRKLYEDNVTPIAK